MDPIYVIANVGGGPIPAWPLWPSAAPGALPAGLNGAGHAWTFPNVRTASFWCGIIRNAFPGTRVWMFVCPSPCTYW